MPGLDFGYRMLTRVLPLGQAAVTERDGELYLTSATLVRKSAGVVDGVEDMAEVVWEGAAAVTVR